jgi:hypothetical protein
MREKSLDRRINLLNIGGPLVRRDNHGKCSYPVNVLLSSKYMLQIENQHPETHSHRFYMLLDETKYIQEHDLGISNPLWLLKNYHPVHSRQNRICNTFLPIPNFIIAIILL